MTQARLLDFGRPGAAKALPPSPSQAMGRYTFTPAGAHSAAHGSDTLHSDDGWVELRATGPLLSEFLTALNATQAEFGRRWNNQHPAT